MNLKHLLKKTFFYKLYNKRNINIEISRNKHFLLEGEELLQVLAQVLNDNKILFWLDFGTLLGYYRDNDFIKHDNDIDIGVKIEDSLKLNKVLSSSGFKLIHKFSTSTGGLEECYRYKNTCVDVFYYNTDENNNSIYCYIFFIVSNFIKFHNKRYKCTVKRLDFPISDFVQVEFKGAQVNIPAETRKYLELSYGKNFMIPDPNYKPESTQTNATYYTYEKIQAQAVIYGRKI